TRDRRIGDLLKTREQRHTVREFRHSAGVLWKRTDNVWSAIANAQYGGRHSVIVGGCHGASLGNCGHRRHDVYRCARGPAHDSAELPPFDQPLDKSRRITEECAIRSEWQFKRAVGTERVGSMKTQHGMVQ